MKTKMKINQITMFCVLRLFGEFYFLNWHCTVGLIFFTKYSAWGRLSEQKPYINSLVVYFINIQRHVDPYIVLLVTSRILYYLRYKFIMFGLHSERYYVNIPFKLWMSKHIHISSNLWSESNETAVQSRYEHNISINTVVMTWEGSKQSIAEGHILLLLRSIDITVMRCHYY